MTKEVQDGIAAVDVLTAEGSKMAYVELNSLT